MQIPETKKFEAFAAKESCSEAYLSPKLEVSSETAKESDDCSISAKSQDHPKEEELSHGYNLVYLDIKGKKKQKDGKGPGVKRKNKF